VAYYGGRERRRRRRRGEEQTRPRALGCLWPMLWVVLIIILLGLLFGGYHKGKKVSAPLPGPRQSVSHFQADAV
jgi:hypothetical protein